MHGHHRRMRMRRHMAMHCGDDFGPRFRGRGRRRGGTMRGFLEEHPDCTEKMLRYGVATMRDEDFSDAEIRAYLEEWHDCGHFDDFDIDEILG